MGVRVNVVSNRDRSKRVIVVINVPLQLEQLQKFAKNKLRVKAIRFFADGGLELEDGANLHQDQVILCSAGEDYIAPGYAAAEGFTSHAASIALESITEQATQELEPPNLNGVDDAGIKFQSLAELANIQNLETWYEVNQCFWDSAGQSNKESIIERAMIGELDSDMDLHTSKAFIDKLLEDGVMRLRESGRGQRSGQGQVLRALDIGAGVGRVTNGLLLRYADEVHLVEGCDSFLQQSRRSLGKKICAQCHFYLYQLQEAAIKVPFPTDGRFVMVFIQLVLQYLIDDDIVALLTRCREASSSSGVIIVKEILAERLQPCSSTGDGASHDSMFFMTTGSGPSKCNSIIRPDAHHRWLFRRAGLTVVSHAVDDGLIMYCLQRM